MPSTVLLCRLAFLAFVDALDGNVEVSSRSDVDKARAVVARDYGAGPLVSKKSAAVGSSSPNT